MTDHAEPVGFLLDREYAERAHGKTKEDNLAILGYHFKRDGDEWIAKCEKWDGAVGRGIAVMDLEKKVSRQTRTAP